MNSSRKLLFSCYLVLFFSFITSEVSGQRKAVMDSLQKTLKNAPPLEKAKNLNRISAMFFNVNLDSAIAYANKSVDVASKNSDYEQLGTAYNYLGQYMYHKADYKTSLAYFDKFKTAATKAKNNAAIAQAINNIANVLLDQGKTEEAIKSYLEVSTVSKAANDKKNLELAYSNLAYVYRYIGDNDKAINYLFEQIKVDEEIKYTKGLGYAYQQLGILFSQKNDLVNAKHYLDLSFNNFSASNDDRNVAVIYDLYSTYFLNAGNLNKAIDYEKMAIQLADKVQDKRSLAIFQSKTGELYLSANSFELAEKAFKLSIDLHEQIKLQKTLAAAYIGYGKALLRLNKVELAKVNLDKGLAIAINQKSAVDRRSAYEALTAYYVNIKQPEKAIASQNQLISIKDSLLNENNSRQINELNTRYETEKKAKQIVMLNNENSIKALQLRNNQLELGENRFLITQQGQGLKINQLELKNKDQLLLNQKLDAKQKAQNLEKLKKQSQIQKLELANRNSLIIIILIVVLAVALLSYLLYNRYKIKQQSLLQTEIYKQHEIATKAVFEGEQNERIRIARDLHDSIGQMLSVVKMNVSTLEPDNAIANGTMDLVDKTIAEVRNISHNLIPETLNFGLFAALEDICEKMSESGKTVVSLSIADGTSAQKLTKQNELSIYRIVQEVLNNMIKHAKASHINININRSDKNLLISIKDNGQGFDTAKINESKGIGWKNISARVHLLDGKMKIASERLIGTQIEISIPE